MTLLANDIIRPYYWLLARFMSKSFHKHFEIHITFLGLVVNYSQVCWTAAWNLDRKHLKSGI